MGRESRPQQINDSGGHRQREDRHDDGDDGQPKSRPPLGFGAAKHAGPGESGSSLPNRDDCIGQLNKNSLHVNLICCVHELCGKG